MALLELDNISVDYAIQRGTVKAVERVSLKLDRGETLGLVGESGCGKTTAAFAITRLLPENGEITEGSITFDGKMIAGSEEEKAIPPRKRAKYVENQMRDFRWDEVSMIFQSAMNAFNPVFKVGDQIAEAIRAHEDMTKEEARKKVLELFRLVGLDEDRIDGFPHEYSGGMRQRGMIAMALACNPKLIIADEPTTALDVIMQDRVLAEIRDLQRRLGMAMIIITHDISVVAEVAEKIGIMYAGRIFEYGDITAIFERPANPYAMGLLASFPSIIGEKKPLYSIPGSPPDLSNPPLGCKFHPRCKYAKEICKDQEPEMIEVEPNHFSLCHFALELFNGQLAEVR